MTTERVAFAHPPSFIGGVGQQPEAISLPSQAKEQINFWASPVDGLRMRHPLEYWAPAVDILNGLHKGPLALKAINRGAGERFLSVFEHQGIRVFSAEDRTAIPVVAHQPGFITINTVPTDNSTVTVDTLGAAAATFTFLAGGVDALQINTTVNSTIALCAARLADAIRNKLTTNVKVWATSNRVYLYDASLGPNATLLAKAGGDSATSITLESNEFDLFPYLKALDTPKIPLLTPEDFSSHMTGLAEDPASGAPADTAPWKYFGTANGSGTPSNSISYTDQSLNPGTPSFAPGPLGGFVRYSKLQAVRGAGSQEAYWFYRFVGDGSPLPEEPTQYNTFAPNTRYQTFSAYILLAGADLTDNIAIGFRNATTGAMYTATFTIALSVLTSLVPTLSSSNITGGAEDLGRGWYRIWASYRTPSTTEAGQQRRPLLYISLPISGAATKQIGAYGAKLEHDVTTPTRFVVPPIEAYKVLTIADQTIVVNTNTVTQLDSSKKKVPNAISVVTFSGVGAPPSNNADIIISPLGQTAITFRFNNGGGADTATLKFIDTVAIATYAQTNSAFIDSVNKHMAGIVHAKALTDTTCRVTDLTEGINGNFLTEANDAGADYAITTLAVGDEAYLWVKQVNYNSSYFVRLYYNEPAASPPVVTKIKASAYTILGPAFVALPRNVCVGFKGWPDAGGVQTETLCQGGAGDANTSDADKGIWYPTTLTAANEILVTPDSELIAHDLAFRKMEAANKEFDYGIHPRWIAANASNNVEVSGSVIRITTPKTISKFETEDSFGNEGLVKCHIEVKAKSELPPTAQDGFTARVSGLESDELDDSYWTFDADTPGTFGRGIWREGLASGSTRRFNGFMMPHRLIRRTDTAGNVPGVMQIGAPYFEFAPIDWNDKLVGNDTLNPSPTFIGNTIRDVFFFENRMGFLSGSNVILSEIASYFNFWLTSSEVEKADDPIDVSTTDVTVALVNHAIPMNESLILFTDRAIYRLELHPGTETPVTIRVLERFENFKIATPAPAERSIFFGHARGDFSGVHELFPSEEAATLKSFDIGGVIPAYIRGEIQQFAVSTLEDFLVCSTNTSRRFIYCFKWHESGGQRVMAAWWKYDLGVDAECLGLAFIENDLFMLAIERGEVSLLRMKVRNKAVDPGATWLCSIDRRVGEETTGFEKTLSGPNTILTLPYWQNANTTMVVVNRTNGASVPIVNNASILNGAKLVTQLTIAGDFSATALWVGELINAAYTFSEPRYKRVSERGAEASIVSREQVQYLDLEYEGTSLFILTSTPKNGGPTLVVHSAPSLDSFKTVSTNPQLESGKKRFPINSRPEEVVLVLSTSSYLPTIITRAMVESLVTAQEQIRG